MLCVAVMCDEFVPVKVFRYREDADRYAKMLERHYWPVGTDPNHPVRVRGEGKILDDHPDVADAAQAADVETGGVVYNVRVFEILG